MIPVTKPYLPDLQKYQRYLQGIYEREWLTNAGPLLAELTRRLEDTLAVPNVLVVANGTLALQVAYRALGISGSVVTTPFSFAATTSSLLWEGLQPLFADVTPDTLTLDPSRIESAIRHDTTAVLPVHVYGTPCDMDAIGAVAEKRGLKVVYDAAHAFGVQVEGRSVLAWGDASILSFHATKLFHSVEGGAVVFRDREPFERAQRLINFGLPATAAGKIPEIGLNAKMSEFHAAMGLCVLDDVDAIIAARLERVALYRQLLEGTVALLPERAGVRANGAYMPVLCESLGQRERVFASLAASGIMARRYFWPSLETAYSATEVIRATHGRQAADRVLCLPLYPDLPLDEVRRICAIASEAMCVARQT